MTSGSGIPAHVAGGAKVGVTERKIDRIQPADVSFSMRMWARWFPWRYDQQIDHEIRAVAGTPLAAHYLRLASRREREDMAEALTLLLRDAGRLPGEHHHCARVPIRADVVQQSAGVVREVVARLRGPLPVRARGMARLRLLLSDGRSPVYRTGTGSFAAAMRGVLAAL